mmetsp:Transcript_85473/g.183220  ORF Transcript_85473/g.183220 Transcript_85473/m.183220 type:complete len:106 (+) Transcript_85473:322-639(+)
MRGGLLRELCIKETHAGAMAHKVKAQLLRRVASAARMGNNIAAAIAIFRLAKPGSELSGGGVGIFVFAATSATDEGSTSAESTRKSLAATPSGPQPKSEAKSEAK